MKVIIAIIVFLVLELGSHYIYGNQKDEGDNSRSNRVNISKMASDGIDSEYSLELKEDSIAVIAAETEMLKKASENIERYRKGDVVIIFKYESGKTVQNAEIEINQKTSDFLFGGKISLLVWNATTKPELYKQRYKGLFNFAVFPFSWAYYESSPGMTQWERTLPVLNWCKENGITTKGDALVWTNPQSVPGWLSDFPVSMSEEFLKVWTINMVKGYKGTIDQWDVVNEPVHTRTWKHVEANYATKEPIQDLADYCEEPFRWAQLANPGGDLVLNEFQQIMSLAIRQRFYNLVAELQKRGTPITGLGIQAHEPWDCWFPPKEVWATFDYYAEFGYPLHITIRRE